MFSIGLNFLNSKGENIMSATNALTNTRALARLELELRECFDQLCELQAQVKRTLVPHADGKPLKGYELVAWLGEVYVKLLYDGRLVSDRHEHDVETSRGWRISVKTRRGNESGWKQSSAIPKFEGEDCPTHLAFVHLHNNYRLDRIWLFRWPELCANNRFKQKLVRGEFRSYIFKLDEAKDQNYLVYCSST